MITIRDYRSGDVIDLAKIYYNTIHLINIKDYTQEQVDVWAPISSLDPSGWEKKFDKTNPIIATIDDKIVGFAEFEPNGHIDCFYCHHEFIGKKVGSTLMLEIFRRANQYNIPCIFVEVSITAKPFFEKFGFTTIAAQTISRNNVELKNFKMETKAPYLT